jgi:tripartite-type tricarboxylate transporter receptor subunit TctC
MANGGLGPHFLAGEIFRIGTGVDITPIAYKGGGEVLKDLIAGHVQFASVELSVASPLMQRGQIRAIGISALRRDAAWPDLPTVAEQGLPGFETTSWFGLFAPAGTPPDVIAALNAEIAKALHDPLTHERLTRVGLTVVGGTVPEAAAFVNKESVKWGKVIRDAGARVKAE